MSANKTLSLELIESGRDIPLSELIFAKRVLDNYTAIACESSPKELLVEIREAAQGVEYFKSQESTCDARNYISGLFLKISDVDSFEEYKSVAAAPRQVLSEIIDDRAALLKHERELLLASGYNV
ncbi:hypothetical protein ACWU4D_10680 [Vibrio sp. WJH972]